MRDNTAQMSKLLQKRTCLESRIQMEVWGAGGGAVQENHGKKTAQNPGPPQELLIVCNKVLFWR